MEKKVRVDKKECLQKHKTEIYHGSLGNELFSFLFPPLPPLSHSIPPSSWARLPNPWRQSIKLLCFRKEFPIGEDELIVWGSLLGFPVCRCTFYALPLTHDTIRAANIWDGIRFQLRMLFTSKRNITRPEDESPDGSSWRLQEGDERVGQKTSETPQPRRKRSGCVDVPCDVSISGFSCLFTATSACCVWNLGWGDYSCRQENNDPN